MKKLLGCLVLGLAVATTNVSLVGCKGEEKKDNAAKKDEAKKDEAKKDEAKK